MKLWRFITLLPACAWFLLATGLAGGAQQSPASPGLFDHLHFRFVGPGGNRVSAVVGEPGNWNVYYAGAASGGLWKSEDGGINWRPIFDKQDAASIGAIAIAPSDHQIVWVGTGEPFIRSNVSIGDGVYKSTDGGKTWQHLGLEKTGRIARIVIDPRNPDLVLVAAEGNCYGPQPERGVFRTTDGGKTWQQVLFVDQNTGASDLAMDPNNPRILLAGTWQMEIKTWGQNSGGPGSGVWMSRDEGATWKRLTGHGLPQSPLGKIAVAIAQRDSNRMYALIETGNDGRGSLWRSDDGGENWRVASYSRLLNERPHYYTRMMIAPDNPNEVYFPCNRMYGTLNGGQTVKALPWGGDNHDMWADPTNSDRMMIGYDGGVLITTTHGKHWNAVVLPVAQMYHVTVDDRIPYYLYGNMQDDSSVRGPSNTRSYGGIPSSIWTTTAGCESGFTIPDPVDSNIVWGGCYAGMTERFDLRTGQTRSVSVWPDKSLDSPAAALKYRWNWTHPIAISPHDHNTVYVGSQYVHKTTDGGQSWQVISPDLTLNDKKHMGISGGLTPDNLGVEYWGTLFAIAESPVQKGVIWTGSNDGLVHVTLDGGDHWRNVTPNMTGLPPYGLVSNIEPSHFEAGRAYVSVEFHQMDNRDPYIYKTTDYGRTWQLIVTGIPKSVFSYVNVVIEDPVRKGLLYAGTENSLYVSFDDGANWQPLQGDLPHAPVSWLAVQKRFDDLVISTKGRGFYILDNIGFLQQMNPTVTSGPLHLFPIHSAYRFRTVSRSRGVPNDVSRGQNPRYGAAIDYYLKEAPKKEVQITILDAQGNKVRTLKGTKQAGLNRVYWDLRYPRLKELELRTTPPSYPQVWTDSRFIGKKTRTIYHYGINPPKAGALATPGKYTVKITVDGQSQSADFTVLKDPHSAGSLADVQQSFALWRAADADVNTVAGMINSIEVVRKQLEDMPDYLKGRADSKEILSAAKELDGKAQSVEDQLFQKYLAAGDTKTFPDEMKLYQRFLWLAGEVGSGAGDVSGNPDFPPTDQEKEVLALLEENLKKVHRQYEELMQKTVPGFNNFLKSKNVLAVIVPQAGTGE